MTKTEQLIKRFEQAGLNLLQMINQLEDGYNRSKKAQLFQQIDKIINDLVAESSELAADIISHEYAIGAKEAIKGIVEQGMSGAALSTSIQSVVHVRAVQAILDDAFYSILEATEHMSRDAKQRVEEAVRRANERSLLEGISRRQATKEAVSELAQQQITGMIAKNGAHIPADKYMSGVIHYHQRKAHVTGAENKIVESGFDLVYVNRVGITCEVCAQYQGRVYSISGRDTRFPKLVVRPPYHSHCVHSLSAWIEQYKMADEVAEMMAVSNQPFKDNRTEQQMRRYEELQREKSRKNETRKQWIRYKARMPDLPDLKTFASHKARNTKQFQEWQEAFRQIGIEMNT